MEVVPTSVGVASRAWDEQHLDLASAARQVGAAPTDGFTAAVAAAATRFAATWERLVAELARLCEGHADALRAAISLYVTSDEVASMTTLDLLEYVEEVR